MNINMDAIKTVEFKHSIGKSRIVITTESVSEVVTGDQENYSEIYNLLVAEANKRGLFALKAESGYSGRRYTYYFQPETKSKLSTSQSNALRNLLQAEITDAVHGSKYRRWTNDDMHFKTRESLVKLGLIGHNEYGKDSIMDVSYSDNRMILSELGREKAQELFPDLTVANYKTERNIEQRRAERQHEIKRAIRDHFLIHLKLSEIYHSVTLEVYRLSGKVEDLKFHFHTSAALGDTVPPKVTVKYQTKGFKTEAGWTMDIVAGQTYGIKTTYQTSAININPLYMAEFAEMVVKANKLITRLNDHRPADYSGELE